MELRDRLTAHRRLRFVGRAPELAMFAAVLASAEPEFAVLHLHGPGGVGKSALLRVFADLAADAGRAVQHVDGHDIRPNPPALLAALGATPTERAVLVVDTFELLAPLDGWFREEFVPSLPAGCIVVVAGRQPPSAGWRADPGWRDLLRVVGLTDLGPAEATAFLAAAGVPAELQASIVAATHGHPLALTLTTDVFAQRGRATSGPDALREPDVLGVLAARLVEEAPDQLHRHALAVSALARVTPERLLREALEVDDARTLFDWLRGLSFMEAGPRGLYPHDLARDVLEADLRWRDDDLRADLRRRIRADAQRRIRADRDQARQESIYDLIFTTRTDPVSQHFSRWETLGSAVPEPVQPADLPDVLALVAEYQGPASAMIAERWYRIQPEAFALYRDRGVVGGLHVLLVASAAATTGIRADPVTAAVWTHIGAQGAPQTDDEVLVNRFMIDRSLGHGPSATSDIANMRGITTVASRPRLAWNAIASPEPDLWAPQYTVLGFERMPPPEPVLGGFRLGLFVRDTRRFSPMHDPLRPTADDSIPEMSRADFEAAVRAALRDLVRADVLARSPLLACRGVRAAGGGPVGLRSVITAATQVLREHPRDEKLYRAIDRTYLHPAPTQERAAEILGLPFSTYRRHLTQGVARILDVLWERETSRN